MNPTLTQLGVRPDLLTVEEKHHLDTLGYVSLGKILSNAQVDAICQRIDALLIQEGENAGSELADSKHIRHPKEAGADRLADLVNKGEEFDVFYTEARLLAGIFHVLGENFKLSALNFRDAKAGDGLQKLHVDWHEAVPAGAYKVCNSIWLLDDFSKENGATRIVPGSHRIGYLPQDVLDDPWSDHPDQVYLDAEAGTVVIFNSHTWHGGTINKSGKRRRAIHSYFCQSSQPQQIEQTRYILPETKARLSLAAQKILDV
ncbi:MAG: phytanoyl-CoA dioxygenase family protein [Bacteroidota bacterium]